MKSYYGKDYYHPSFACVFYSQSPNGVRAASCGGAANVKGNLELVMNEI